MENNEVETEIENNMNDTITEVKGTTENEAPNDNFELSAEDIEILNSNVNEAVQDLEESDNMLLAIQAVEEQSDNIPEETQEADTTIKDLEEQKAKIAKFKSKIPTKPIEFAKLSVPYNDTSILETNSIELELVDYFFDSVSGQNKGVPKLLYEMIGYSLAKTAKLGKAFVLKRWRSAEIGKSTIFRIIEALLKVETGVNLYERQCSHEHLENLCGCKAGSKTTIKQLEGCTVNIAEDQKQPKHIDIGLITRLISGEPISIKQKGDDNLELISYATLLFSVNDEVINFKETSLSIIDRFIVVPFNATFTTKNDNRDIDLVERLCQPKSLQIIATRAIQAFKEVLERGSFTIPKSIKEETKKYFRQCNNAVDFCNLYPIDKFIGKKQYYIEYCTWCEENNLKALDNSNFGKVVISFNYNSENHMFGGTKHTYYVNPKFDTERFRGIYRAFKLDKEVQRINYHMTFEEYLGIYLYLKEQEKLEIQEEQEQKKIEPEILLDNT